mmetsp:Transcript_26373/g.54675  ORF Transcript_26373/g.54675 Transcript_26373/m.54675 type:complete len:264 (-) Transcript_26373:180-971(-)
MGTNGPRQGRKWQRELAEILREVNVNSTPEHPCRKTVYFVRHAQSRSNVAKAKMVSSNFRESAEGAAGLIRAGFNAPLSALGRQQLQSVRPHAQSLCQELEAVLYSPLQRATDTALGLFGEASHTTGETLGGAEANLQPPTKMFWRPVRALKEKRPKEHMQEMLPFHSENIMESRVRGVVCFLAALPWTRFAVVGHSNFFRAVLAKLGVRTYLCNAHIYRAELCHSAEGGLACSSYDLVASPSTPGCRQDGDGDNADLTDFGN